jgi:pimeloyl-ACP methyl ester carboxylesterase
MRGGHAEAAGGNPRDRRAPTVVIAHGAWVDATGWREVIALLQLESVHVIAVQNPLSSLAEDVDAVSRAINQLSGPVVLVGHGYGGTIITQAGNHPSVAALVYVAAFAPDSGESTMDSKSEYPPRAAVARLEVDSGGYLYLAPESVPQFLAQDLPATDTRVLAATQQPIRASALLNRVTVAAWRAKPCWYVVADDDRMISPALQRRLAARMKAHTCVLSAGHAPFLSKPRETADVILLAVSVVRRTNPHGRTIVEPRDGA